MFLWGAKNLSSLGNNCVLRGARGLSCPMDIIVPWGNLNPLLPKGKNIMIDFFGCPSGGVF